ncbi:MAG: PaaI family thioesterase [Stenotrophobium sp.]
MNAFSAARQAARMQGDFEQLIGLVPYARYLRVGLQLHDGQPRSHLPFAETLIGNTALPALHGGVTAAFMENAAILHLLLQLDEARVPKSIDFSIDYLKPGRAEDCYADCEVSRAGQRVAQVMIRCWQKSPDQPIAVARAHFLLGTTA